MRSPSVDYDDDGTDLNIDDMFKVDNAIVITDKLASAVSDMINAGVSCAKCSVY